jgi:hypothetical protein
VAQYNVLAWYNAFYPMGTNALSLGVKRPGGEADRYRLYGVEVKNEWNYTSSYTYRPTTLESSVVGRYSNINNPHLGW